MHFDLVNSGLNLEFWIGEKFFEVVFAEVGDSDCSDFTRCGKFLEFSPGFLEVPVREGFFAAVVAGVDGLGPVHEVEIDVVGSEALEGFVDGFGDAALVGVIQFCGEEELVSWDAGGLPAGSYFGFVLVGGGGVDVSVAVLQCGFNGLLDLARW